MIRGLRADPAGRRGRTARLLAVVLALTIAATGSSLARSAGAEAWSRGDLDGFLSGYAEDVRSAAPSGTVAGRAALGARYRERFPDARAMGQLSFEPLDVRVASGVEFTPSVDALPGRVRAVSVLARWHIEREGAAPASGVTLVVLQRRADGWAIVQDLSF